jgi:serine/threonine protein kinase
VPLNDLIYKSMWQLFEAVEYLHKKAIVHRAISVDSVFITKEGTTVLGNFGRAKRYSWNQIKQEISVIPNIFTPPEYKEGRLGN